MRLLLSVFLAISFCFRLIAAEPDYAAHIASLIDPLKLATLRERGANSRVQKCVYWLEAARKEQQKPETVIDLAVTRVGITNRLAAKLTKEALLRNLSIAEKLGCLDVEGLSEMRRGNAATVRLGPYKGDELSVDHIIPRKVVPELDNVIANLELMPLRVNQRKNAKIGQRQHDLAQKLYEAGLLSKEGLKAVQSKSREPVPLNRVTPRNGKKSPESMWPQFKREARLE